MTLEVLILLVLLLMGIGLVLLETFFIPGFGIAGIAGIAFYVGGVMYAFSLFGAKVGTFVFCVSLIVGGLAFIFLIKSKALDRLALKTNITSTVADDIDSKIEVGDNGVTLSRLNPIGRAEIKGEIVEAKSDAGFLDENTPVTVVRVNSGNISVVPSINNK